MAPCIFKGFLIKFIVILSCSDGALFDCSAWQLDSPNVVAAKKVTMALEGSVGPGFWMGFGFNSPTATEVRHLQKDWGP